MQLLIKNIRCLIQTEDIPRKWVAGSDMAKLNFINDAFLFIQDGIITDFGEMESLKKVNQHTEIIDATGRFVFPSFCDSHTHIVYAGSREIEYIDKIRGLTYEEIAKRGGGILNSARLLHQTSEDELYSQSICRINEIISTGTGAIEIKSGYGLNIDDEIKMLRVIKRIKEKSPVEVKATFLGAHSVPSEYSNNKSGYVDYVISEMIPAVSYEGLADYIDVFLRQGILYS